VSLFQNSVSFRIGFRKSGLKPVFSIKSKVVVPKLKFWNNLGYIFELKNCEVEYFGIEMKLNDLGRDLIVKRNNTTKIVQCKYWSKNKTIHEKHIVQLFGTVTKYKMDNPNEKNAAGLFVSHTVLSDEAKNFANALGQR
jgi:hypothetical protein